MSYQRLYKSSTKNRHIVCVFFCVIVARFLSSFCSRFPLCCLLSACIDGSHRTLFSLQNCNLILLYNMKYDSKLPDSKVIMSHEFNNSSIQNGRTGATTTPLGRNVMWRRGNRTGKSNRRLEHCVVCLFLFLACFHIVIVQ